MQRAKKSNHTSRHKNMAGKLKRYTFSRHKRLSSTIRKLKGHTQKKLRNIKISLPSVEDGQFNQGYALGYASGLRHGQEHYGSLLEGTSIIIPTYNKVELLRACIESIQAYTPSQHEIIVVDNASTDGTLAYLESLAGKVRIHINESNRGFSGAVNIGLMMAKGETICILNNDTLVTPNWLSNLLICLNSDPHIGIVGPVTNYISGDQQIEVPYREIEQMWRFAAHHNKSNPQTWLYTDRIVGFCFVFHRRLLEAVGYLDEGYEIGNFEDEDYITRVKISGRKLVIAKDSFIHHHGSQSMKALGNQLNEVNERNGSFFSAKWADPHEWTQRSRRMTINERGETILHYQVQHLYPTHVAVTGLSDRIYWIEHGVKYPLQGSVHIPIVRLSQNDLLGYVTGAVWSAAEAEARWKLNVLADGTIADGAVFQTEHGKLYQRQGEVCREWMTPYALTFWRMDGKIISISDQERQKWSDGLPIMAAPVLKSYLI